MMMNWHWDLNTRFRLISFHWWIRLVISATLSYTQKSLSDVCFKKECGYFYVKSNLKKFLWSKCRHNRRCKCSVCCLQSDFVITSFSLGCLFHAISLYRAFSCHLSMYCFILFSPSTKIACHWSQVLVNCLSISCFILDFSGES